jgi:enterochelin esterase family protein
MKKDTPVRRQNQIRRWVVTLAAGSLLFSLAAWPALRGPRGLAREDREAVRRAYVRLTSSLPTLRDSTVRAEAVEEFRRCADSLGAPVTHDSAVTFVYFGSARRVRVAGEFNGWNPESDTLTPVEGTRMFHRTLPLRPDARVEYKLVVDSLWVLDPLNPRVAAGGYGENSDLRMPRYTPDAFAISRAGVARGSIDTLFFASTILGRTHPLFVYVPHRPGPEPLPAVYVLDGGQYLEFARMHRALDNMIADGILRPILVVFADPRTDLLDPGSNTRRVDYALSEDFLRALVKELVPFISGRFRVSGLPGQTAIMGASLGGLTATYAVWRAPDVFGTALVQSPAYWWENEKLLRMMTETPARGGRFFIDTGIYHDALPFAPKVRDLLVRQGREVAYAEVPQGHNWTHWQSRTPAALRFFAGRGR